MSFENRKILKQVDFLNPSHDNSSLAVVMPVKKEGELTSLASLEVQESAPSFLFSKTIISPQIEFIVEKNDKLAEILKFKRFLKKIKQCRKGTWIKIKHKCGGFVVDEKGEPIRVRITCDDKYCDDPFCIESRKIKAKQRLDAYKVTPKKLIHLIMSFPWQFGETKEQSAKRELVIRYTKEEMQKLGIKIHGLFVFDIKAKGEGNLKRYLPHYHFALYPQNHARFVYSLIKARKVILKKTGLSSENGFTLTSKNYKPKKALFRYFAKIMAGLVSDEEEHHTTTYNKIMPSEEYFNFFYGKRVLRVWGLEKFVCRTPEPERSEYMFQRLGRTLPEKCSFCGETITPDSIKLIKEVGEQKPPNPDGVFAGLNWHLSY